MSESEDTVLFKKSDVPQASTFKPEPCLVQITGGEAGRLYKLSKLPLTIGRSKDCDISCDDPHISRVHAEVIQGWGDDIVVRDMGSSNGLLVNETKLGRFDKYVLKDGDKILIGEQLCLRFAYQDLHDESYQKNLYRAANVDALTGLYNKKYFLDTLERELMFTHRSRQPLSLLLLDVDFFKKFNDEHGHIAGDEVLRNVGLRMQESVRNENLGCRYGGEEFAVILRNTDRETARTVAERLRESVSQHPTVYQGKNLSVTISVGVATALDEKVKTVEDFIRLADAKLYEAKSKGRNRTVD